MFQMDEDGERRKVGQGNKFETSSTEDSDSSESNFEDYNVLPYQCDPYFKNREDLEQFLKGCDNRVESNREVRMKMWTWKTGGTSRKIVPVDFVGI